MFFAAAGTAEPEMSGRETGDGAIEPRPPIFNSAPSMSVRASLAHCFFSVCFPFAGTGWASIGGGEGEAELLVTEGAACQVREATAKAAASVHCCFP